MRRLLQTAPAISLLIFLVNFGVSANEDSLSVEVLGDQQIAGKPFIVRIRNNADKRLTYCMTTCGKLIDAETTAKIPAFTIQKRSRKRWDIQLWRCDTGDSVASRVIHGSEVEEFKIKLLDPGTYRLRLPYKDVSVEGVGLHCEAIDDPRSMKQAVSDEFDVVAKSK
ncbi:MAG: hypothetical protein WA224_00870 [Candidatus Acidiferrales bacterium]